MAAYRKYTTLKKTRRHGILQDESLLSPRPYDILITAGQIDVHIESETPRRKNQFQYENI